MLCCFFIKLPFKGLGATAGKVRAVAFDTVWGLARICLCGRPKEGGRNTKAKLAIKQELFSVLLSGYTVFWCNRSNTKPQRTVHQLFRNKSERQRCNMLHICHPDRKRKNPVLTAVLKLCHPRHPVINTTPRPRQPCLCSDK